MRRSPPAPTAIVAHDLGPDGTDPSPERGDAALRVLRHRGQVVGVSAGRPVDLREVQPLSFGTHGCLRVDCRIAVGGRELGRVRVAAPGEALTFARLRDAIATQLGDAVLAPKARAGGC
jgi:hypothetical protein